MDVTVIVPTYKRVDKLKNCLNSLSAQTYAPSEVIVTYHQSDKESCEVAQSFSEKLNLKLLEIEKPGVVAAENSAISNVQTEIVAFLDDDGIAPRDWLERIIRLFESDSLCAAVGGTDIILQNMKYNYRVPVETFGKLTWYGKVIGNHHFSGVGIREVDVLKGVNMAFRRDALNLIDLNLESRQNQGNGSHWELDLCLSVKRQRRKLLLDPSLEVEHDSDHSENDLKSNAINNAHNLTYVLLKHLPLYRKIIFLFYVFVVGNTQQIGVLKFFANMIKFRSVVELKKYLYSFTGYVRGVRTYLKQLRQREAGC